MRGDGRRRTSAAISTAGCGLASLVGAVVILGSLAVWLASCNPTEISIGTPRNDGTRSARLPVDVSPRTDLADGTVVTVTSDAFEPHRVVGVAVCLEEADTESAGVDACDEVQGARFAATAEGGLSATYPVPRVITVDGVAHDCAAPEMSCVVVAADATDYDQSGGQRITFRTDLGPTDLVAMTERAHSLLLPVLPPTADALTPGATVEVTASGFQPGEPVLVAHCVGFPTRDATSTCQPVDRNALTVLFSRSVVGVERRADESGIVVVPFTALERVEPVMAASPTRCTPSAGCSFVIGAAADIQRSAVVPYSVVG